jgi:hypothetical protein
MGAENRVCIQYDGQLYCWDDDEKCFVVGIVQKIPSEKIPAGVVEAIIARIMDDAQHRKI